MVCQGNTRLLLMLEWCYKTDGKNIHVASLFFSCMQYTEAAQLVHINMCVPAISVTQS